MNAVVDSLWESCYIKMSGVPSDLDSLSRILLDGPGWGRGQDVQTCTVLNSAMML